MVNQKPETRNPKEKRKGKGENPKGVVMLFATRQKGDCMNLRRVLVLVCLVVASSAIARERWSEEEARGWGEKMPWLVGCNFGPSTAINELEMWQADTFDLPTIDRELGWAEGLGFNSVRVFLHDLAWRQDREGFLKRLDQFLEVADKHHIGVDFVLFDSVW